MNNSGEEMRKCIVCLLGLLVSFNVWATEFHDFMDAQGRSIRGKILRFDGRKRMVTIERDNRKTATVPVSIFSEEDQGYIKEWSNLEGVCSTSKFKISCERRTVKSWTKEALGTISYTDGSREKNQVVGKHHYKEVGYDIILQNNNDYDLSGLTLEYCIFYEQNTGNGEKPGVRYVSTDLDDIQGQKKAEVASKTVVVFKYETHAEFINSRVWKGEVEGIWVRISTVGKDGRKKVLRDVSMPAGIMESRAWRDQSKPVGENKG